MNKEGIAVKCCPKCEVDKPRHQSFSRNQANKDGYALWCRDCVMERRYARQNPDSKRAKVFGGLHSGKRTTNGALVLDAHWRGRECWSEVVAVQQRWRAEI